MNEEIKDLLRQIYDSWFGATEKPRMGFTSHTIHELDKAGYEIVKKDQWQSIETAPKDETRILTFTNERCKCCPKYTIGMSVAYWNKDHAVWSNGSLNGKVMMLKHQPTHWQPLPKPPNATEDNSI